MLEERAAGRGGWQVGDSAGHVTEKSKGMYLKVSSRLATSTAHRPHLPAGLAQRSRPGSGRSRSSPVCLRSLRGFSLPPSLSLFLFSLSPGTVAKPAASAATAAHTGESHPGSIARESLKDCFYHPVTQLKANKQKKNNKWQRWKSFLLHFLFAHQLCVYIKNTFIKL